MSDSTAIGVGYNVAQLSLTRVTTINPDGDQPLADPKTIPLWDDGEIKVRLSGLVDPIGYAAITWEFGFMTWAQYAYLRTTYCNGGLSGYVTIYTTVDGGDNYERLNAIMILPTPKAMQAEYWYKPTSVTFTHLAAAA